MYKTVLFPLEAGPEAKQVAGTALELAQLCNSRLVLLSVVEVDSETDPDATAAALAQATAAAAQLLEQAKTLFEQQGIESQTIERQGNPAFVICDVADEVAADLIIMGCRGIGLTEGGHLESVSSRVINLSPCPVLIVP
ncbi:universal stress protein [Romeria aff. gracilis LEGE 07310]|uniref:Universal stress protein n=1 Tax=Vasconcelosia minhoensis LEGE 07310 TaxID=915328 RepID=A0A8J7AJN6_9CYAN|nr:universal stress protein [Romeria gracilis]MBE9076605.1 universal stress protein [Romeria aff. gracilis LEGE 07310]